MKRQKENIDLLIEKVAVICLFLLILFAFKSTDCPNRDSFSKSAYHTFNRIPIHVTSTIEQISEVNKLAILVEPISFSAFDNGLAPIEFVTFNICDKENFKIINSNNKVNQLLKNCKEQFIVIKPRIIDLDSFHIRTALNNEEISSIS
jgi:hypothetical protein